MRLTLIAISAFLLLFGGQKKISASWEKALQPVDRLDRQAILDALICTQAYQMGVDRLHFRSEVVACW